MSKPFFSIIMACTLSDYKGAAKDRERKLIRAIESVIAQNFQDWELIVVADGCEDTFNLVGKKYHNDKRIHSFLLLPQPKERVWKRVNDCRNYGHKISKGDYICYLDSDDCFGTEHLHKMHIGIEYLFTKETPDFVFFDDRVATIENDTVGSVERKCHTQRGKCGTSNITFKTSLPVSWEDQTYLHDWKFIQKLMRYGIKQIQACEYIVCHIPSPVNLDV